MPMTKFHNGARRKVAYGNGQAGARSLKVPLIDPHPQGQWFEGDFRVPLRLANTKPHTNERLEFQRLVESMLDRWAEWRLKGGWEMTGNPIVGKPHDPAVETERHPIPDYKVCTVRCRFKRTSPLFVGLDDFLHEKRLADIYGVNLEADRLPWNDVESGTEDTGWGDPMKWAEAERQKLGLKREDYLFGDLSEPFGTPPKTEGKGWQRVKL